MWKRARHHIDAPTVTCEEFVVIHNETIPPTAKSVRPIAMTARR